MHSFDYEKEYFDWLCNFICDREYEIANSHKSYSRLLEHLHSREFIATIVYDENRISDGENLRGQFCDEKGYSRTTIGIILTDGRPCSILEMMVALALRCENTIMDDDAVGNRIGQWFWTMVVNLGLGPMTNDHYDQQQVDYILERFINREYSPYGEGGLFILKNPRRDMREVEIWYQLCWFLSENY